MRPKTTKCFLIMIFVLTAHFIRFFVCKEGTYLHTLLMNWTVNGISTSPSAKTKSLNGVSSRTNAHMDGIATLSRSLVSTVM